MPQGPYAGAGYQMAAIGAQVPQGYMRGLQFGQQQQMGQQELQKQQLANQAAEISMQHGQQEYAGMQQSAAEATDDQGNLDIDKFYKGLAQRAPNTFMQHMNSYGGMVYRQGQLGIQQQKVQQAGAKGIEAAVPGMALGLSQIKDPAQRQQAFDTTYAPFLEHNGMSPNEIASYRDKITDDTFLGGVANSSLKKYGIDTGAQTRMNVAQVNAEARIAAAKISASARLTAVRLGFTEKPLSNVEAQFYQDMKAKGAAPEDAMETLANIRADLAEAKKKNVDPATAASNAVNKIESTWGTKSAEKRDELFGSYYRLFSEAKVPEGKKIAVPRTGGTPAPSGQVQTKVNPANGQTYYLWPDGKYHSTAPGK